MQGTRGITEVDRFQTEDKFIRAKDLMAEILAYFLAMLIFKSGKPFPLVMKES